MVTTVNFAGATFKSGTSKKGSPYLAVEINFYTEKEVVAKDPSGNQFKRKARTDYKAMVFSADEIINFIVKYFYVKHENVVKKYNELKKVASSLQDIHIAYMLIGSYYARFYAANNKNTMNINIERKTGSNGHKYNQVML